jgi:hypothetical protein
MAVIARRIFGLRLAAQHHLVDLLALVGFFGAEQDLVEIAGPQRLAARHGQVERFQELAQGDDLLAARRIVDAIEQGHLVLFQRLGGAHV